MIKSSAEISTMRRAGRVVDTLLDLGVSLARPGVRPTEIETAIRETAAELGAELPFYNYQGFPAACCISVNEIVVHGVPSREPLRAGDIVTIDLGARVEGYCADAARTLTLSPDEPLVQRLRECVERALDAGIAAAWPNQPIRKISEAIDEVVTSYGYSTLLEYVGHGIGQSMHEEPQVPNTPRISYRGLEVILREGMVLAIDPTVVPHTNRTVLLGDGWSVATADGSPSAHSEDTVLITAAGPEILTRS